MTCNVRSRQRLPSDKWQLSRVVQRSVWCVESRHSSQSSTLTGTLTRWASEDLTTSSRLFLDERLLRVSSLLKSSSSSVPMSCFTCLLTAVWMIACFTIDCFTAILDAVWKLLLASDALYTVSQNTNADFCFDSQCRIRDLFPSDTVCSRLTQFLLLLEFVIWFNFVNCQVMLVDCQVLIIRCWYWNIWNCVVWNPHVYIVH